MGHCCYIDKLWRLIWFLLDQVLNLCCKCQLLIMSSLRGSKYTNIWDGENQGPTCTHNWLRAGCFRKLWLKLNCAEFYTPYLQKIDIVCLHMYRATYLLKLLNNWEIIFLGIWKNKGLWTAHERGRACCRVYINMQIPSHCSYISCFLSSVTW